MFTLVSLIYPQHLVVFRSSLEREIYLQQEEAPLLVAQWEEKDRWVRKMSRSNVKLLII